MGDAPLTCRELVEVVTDYLEGAMPPVERARFDDHLRRCAGCRAYVDQMRRTIELTGRVREDDLAPATRERLVTLFRDWRGR